MTPFADGRWFIRDGDFTRQFFLYHSFGAQELWAGRLPLWNPYVVGGHPFLADIQTAVFYPLGLLAALVFGGDGLTLVDVQYRAVANYFLAGLFAYLLGYRLTRNYLAGAATALVFAYGSYLTSYPLQQLPILETAVWLPLQIVVFDVAAQRRGSPVWIGLGSLTIAISMLAGHPQTFLFNVYAVATYAIYLAVNDARKACPDWFGALRRVGVDLVRLAVTLALGLGLSGVQLGPSAELLLLSNRVEMPYQEAAWGYQFSSLLGALVPDWQDGHSVYAGLLPLLLAGVAARRWRDRGTVFWVALLFAALLLSTGGNGPLYPLFHSFAPGFALFRSQERVILLYSLAVAVLSGKGLALLLDSQRLERPRQVPLIVLAVPLLLAMAAIWARTTRGPEAGVPQFAYAGLVLLSSLALLLLIARGRRAVGVLGAMSLCLIALDLVAVNFGSNLSPSATWPSSDVQRVVSAVHMDIAERAPGAMARLRIQTVDEEAFWVNAGHLIDLQQLGGDTPFFQQRLENLRGADQEWRLWQLLNVRYTVSRRDLDPGGLDYLGRFGEFRLYRVQWPVPRIWAARDVRVARSEAEALQLTFHRDISPGASVVLDEALANPMHGPPPRQSHKVIEYGPQRMVVDSSVDASAVLVAAEAYYPGWRVFVDGVEGKLLRVNYYLRGVVLPAGRHIVEFRYEPSSLRLGAGVSVVSSAIVGALCALGLRKRSRKPGLSSNNVKRAGERRKP